MCKPLFFFFWLKVSKTQKAQHIPTVLSGHYTDQQNTYRYDMCFLCKNYVFTLKQTPVPASIASQISPKTVISYQTANGDHNDKLTHQSWEKIHSGHGWTFVWLKCVRKQLHVFLDSNLQFSTVHSVNTKP